MDKIENMYMIQGQAARISFIDIFYWIYEKKSIDIIYRLFCSVWLSIWISYPQSYPQLTDTVIVYPTRTFAQLYPQNLSTAFVHNTRTLF